MKILITGANGYLGSKLAERLADSGYEIIALLRQSSDANRLNNLLDRINIIRFKTTSDLVALFSEQPIDTVIHTAASYGRKGESIDEIVQSNINFPSVLLDLAIKSNVRLWINTGTALHRHTNAYAASKHAFTDILHVYSKSIKTVNLVLEYFYGSDDEDWKFINMLFHHFKKKSAHIDFTSGKQQRFFYHITDTVSAFELLLNQQYWAYSNTRGMQHYHVIHQPADAISIRVLAEQCQSIAGANETQLRFGVLPDREEENNPYMATIPSITELGWAPKISLSKGLQEVWNSIRSN